MLAEIVEFELKRLNQSDIDVDPILIDYVCAFVTENTLGTVDQEEMESLCEMISAYIPQIDKIYNNSDTFRKWLEGVFSANSAQQSSSKEVQFQADMSQCSFKITDSHKQQKSPEKSIKSGPKESLDDQLKTRILSKHGLIGESVGTRADVIKPQPLKTVDKETKTRYLDGKVVSNKGDRFITIKDEREDTEEMKKTYVNLKPAKKYRFH